MQTTASRSFFRLMAPLLSALWLPATLAQTQGALYDPQPPADSAYLRVIVVSATKPFDVLLDGKTRVPALAAATPSDYMVVKAGKHQLTLRGGAPDSTAEVPLDVVAGRTVTVALDSLRPDVKPVLFQDRTNANKLKALLTVYHLTPGLGPVDMLTADGATRVFSGVAQGASASLSVNPVAVDLQAHRAGDATPLARAGLNMSNGTTYSLWLLPGESGKPVLRPGVNMLERYTGK
jgi:alginate O-acetyltransferase complex protein AlgF